MIAGQGELSWETRTRLANGERAARGLPPISDTARYGILDVRGDVLLVESEDILAVAGMEFQAAAERRCGGRCARCECP